MHRDFLRKQGHTEDKIQEKLEQVNPDAKSLNIGDSLAGESAQPWPLTKKLTIDWRIP